jgi:hypothetical protein
MDNKTALPVFYSQMLVADHWAPLDLLYWRAVGQVPEAFFPEGEIELRDMLDYFQSSPESFGVEYDYMEDEIAEALNISPDPRWRPFSWQGEVWDPIDIWEPESPLFEMVNNDGTPLFSSDEQKQKRDLAEAYSSKVEAWMDERDDAFELAKAECFTALRRGTLRAFSVKVARDDESRDDGFSQSLSEWFDTQEGDRIERTPVDPSEWKAQNIDWLQSKLVTSTAEHWGIVVKGVEALQVFPPDLSKVTSIVSCGVTLMDVDEKSKTPTPKSSSKRGPGRPSKGKELIPLRIAEIIQERGALPIKREALYEELVSWFSLVHKQDIGRSTVARIASQYYDSPNIGKSQ